MSHYKMFVKKLLAVSLSVSLVFASQSFSGSYATSESLSIQMIDVGQGDSIYIQYQDYDILIDAGENNMGTRVVDYLKPRVHGDLDMVIATHPDSDHIGGLDTVLSSFKVDRIIDSGYISSTVTYKDYWSEVQKQVKSGAVYTPDDDMSIKIGNATLNIIETGDNNGSNNDNSVVARLQIGKVSCLFTGDMESDIEKTILDKAIQSDLLKAGHHGSGTSSCKEFVDVVKPQAVLISAGLNNKYGHPSPETVSLFNGLKIPYYLTSSIGSIIVNTDGNTFEVGGKTFIGHSDNSSDSGNNNPGGDEPSDHTNPGGTAKVIIDALDPKAEFIVLKNSGTIEADLSHWVVLSTIGNQRFEIPDGTILKPGATLKIVSGKAYSSAQTNDLKWSKAYIWADAYDPAELSDAQGNLISSYGK